MQVVLNLILEEGVLRLGRIDRRQLVSKNASEVLMVVPVRVYFLLAVLFELVVEDGAYLVPFVW